MSWTWQLSPAVTDPDLAADVATGWDSQAEAESWLKDTFADLADEGVREVTLLNGATTAYSMSLDDPAW